MNYIYFQLAMQGDFINLISAKKQKISGFISISIKPSLVFNELRRGVDNYSYIFASIYLFIYSCTYVHNLIRIPGFRKKFLWAFFQFKIRAFINKRHLKAK